MESLFCYISISNWQVQAIEKAVAKANNKKPKFIEHEKVATWLTSWGSENEHEYAT